MPGLSASRVAMGPEDMGHLARRQCCECDALPLVLHLRYGRNVRVRRAGSTWTETTSVSCSTASPARSRPTAQREPVPRVGGGIIGILGRWDLGDLTGADRDRITRALFHEGARFGPFARRFAALMTMSVLIAVMGLLADSTAVVIGAMLVAPLMTPVLGISAAVSSAGPLECCGRF